MISQLLQQVLALIGQVTNLVLLILILQLKQISCSRTLWRQVLRVLQLVLTHHRLKRPATRTHVLHIVNPYRPNLYRLVPDVCRSSAQRILIYLLVDYFLIRKRRWLRIVDLFYLRFVYCVDLLQSIHSRLALELRWTDYLLLCLGPFCRVTRVGHSL